MKHLQKKLLRSPKGFTLIELIVVIALIGIMVTFAVPRFNVTFFDNDINTTAKWFISNVPVLKEKAVTGKTTCLLRINLDTNQIWATADTMSEEELSAAEENAYRISEAISIADIWFPDGEIISSGTAKIYFYGEGYSDMAIIHLKENDIQLSVIIESFLTSVQVADGYVELES